jgi:hypothetical protein
MNMIGHHHIPQEGIRIRVGLYQVPGRTSFCRAHSRATATVDSTDEAEAFQAGFDIESASPGQGTIVNGIAAALNKGGIVNAVDCLGAHTSYSTLPAGPINVDMRSPSIYAPPK